MSLKAFNIQLNIILGKLQHENKHVYITGDFNVNVLLHIKSSLDTHTTSRTYSRQVFFTPLITKPTRVTIYSSTLIDNIIYIIL